MSEIGVITEQGYVTERTNQGYSPIKEEEDDPFNNKKGKKERDRG
jgi:hypothetical protein